LRNDLDEAALREQFFLIRRHFVIPKPSTPYVTTFALSGTLTLSLNIELMASLMPMIPPAFTQFIEVKTRLRIEDAGRASLGCKAYMWHSSTLEIIRGGILGMIGAKVPRI
jgi:hypothetical protein